MTAQTAPRTFDTEQNLLVHHQVVEPVTGGRDKRLVITVLGG